MAFPIADDNLKVTPPQHAPGAGDVKKKADGRWQNLRHSWKTTDFALLWAGSAISTIGTRTLGVAYPLLALALTDSPSVAGWTGFALTIPILVFYVPAGVLVDRVPARSSMLFAEFMRGLTVASVLVALPFGGPSLAHLIVAALLEGTLWVLYTLAETSLLPSLVQPATMRRALAKSEAAAHAASLAGRPLGGYLFGVGHIVPFFANAVLFLVSSGLFFHVRRAPARPPSGPSLLRDLLQGFRLLKGQPFLRASILLVTITNLMVNALIMIFLAGSSGLPSLTVGLVLAAGGVGGVVGSIVAFSCRPFRRMLMIHLWIWVVALGCAAAGAALDQRAPLFALALFVTGLGGALSNVSIRTVEVDAVDPRALARVVGVSRLSAHGALSLAAPLGGLLVSGLGVTGGSVLLFAVMAVLAVLVSSVPSLRENLTPALPAAADVGTSVDVVPPAVEHHA
ncbi:Predicted arabinose efflux permease, MFS family [Nonomuraea pusilla]|uniref:Predicted arabinose efflux permease, MFS family n=1 Tax=Nonomuraea pusilla TaxID=46177 RepID=A0A1H7RY47_9ACTN|nr:Predicted arabinose efflux permease, MFS family [Nonomuraea pusilla]